MNEGGSKGGFIFGLLGGILGIIFGFVTVIYTFVRFFALPVEQNINQGFDPEKVVFFFLLGASFYFIILSTWIIYSGIWMRKDSSLKKGAGTALCLGVLTFNLLAITGGILGLFAYINGKPKEDNVVFEENNMIKEEISGNNTEIENNTQIETQVSGEKHILDDSRVVFVDPSNSQQSPY